MFIAIDFQSGQPIYEQVVTQIKFAIAADTVKEGEMIPSIRDLAQQLTLNPNTVARAFHQLKTEGITITRRGDGVAVAKGAAEKCVLERQAYFTNRFQAFLDEATRSRLPKSELEKIISPLMFTSVGAEK
ncbi:GntR family transcriptional regulator [Planctomycetales bacterium]|nr:GntR family transcriptional regulator [Planctomycetales bacterium]